MPLPLLVSEHHAHGCAAWQLHRQTAQLRRAYGGMRGARTAHATGGQALQSQLRRRITGPMTEHRFRAIAHVRSPYARRIDAPHQSTVVQGTESGDAADALIVFDAAIAPEAYRDLAGMTRVWLLFVFDRSEGWKAEVRPPRGGGKRSVLATRSPHRPNAIGLSAVELVAIEPGALRVRGVDLLDGTPVLDIKPYVPYADAFPDSAAGWIDAIDARTGRHSAPGPKRPR